MAAPAPENPEITILITAHNEAERVPASLQAILAQDYPMERVEIILVDDRSSDGTAEIARRMNNPALRVLELKEKPTKLTTRQAALDMGMRAARGDIVLLTDAGGRVPREWLRELTGHLGHRDGAVTAPVVFAGHADFLNSYLTIDALVQFTFYRWMNSRRRAAGLFGANAAIRREAYQEAGGFSEVGFSLVEDEALGHALAKRKWSLRYLPDPFVLNPGPVRFRELFSRARRIATGPTRTYHNWMLGLALSNVLLVVLAVHYKTHFWELVLLLRYLGGLLTLGFMMGRYPTHQSGGWLVFYEPLTTIIVLFARLVNLVRPRWSWGGLVYGREGLESP